LVLLNKIPKGYQFKITLQDIEPPIWRRFIVPQDINMADFAAYITDAMQWRWFFLNRFHIDKAMIMPDFEWKYFDYRILHYNYIRDFLHCEIEFEYYACIEDDRELGWMHTVEYEGEAMLKTNKPVCIDGARACPPDEVGFEEGYNDLLKAIANDDDQKVYDLLDKGYGDWNEDDIYDPEAFDKTKCNFRPAGDVDYKYRHKPPLESIT